MKPLPYLWAFLFVAFFSGLFAFIGILLRDNPISLWESALSFAVALVLSLVTISVSMETVADRIIGKLEEINKSKGENPTAEKGGADGS